MKDYREKEMKYLLGALLLFFVYFCTPVFESVSVSNFAFDKYVSIVKYIISLGIISLSVFLGDCLISSNVKNKLVGFYFIPLAGSTIFTKISCCKVKDARFTNEEAKKMYESIISRIPKNKEKFNYENSCWYKIYQKYKGDGAVVQSQKDYLACRDLYIECILFMLMYFISILIFPSFVRFSWGFLFILVVVGTIINCATHTKMNRFVNTVIALDIANKEE